MCCALHLFAIFTQECHINIADKVATLSWLWPFHQCCVRTTETVSLRNLMLYFHFLLIKLSSVCVTEWLHSLNAGDGSWLSSAINDAKFRSCVSRESCWCVRRLTQASVRTVHKVKGAHLNSKASWFYSCCKSKKKPTSPLISARILLSSSVREKTLNWLKCLKDSSDNSHTHGNHHPRAFYCAYWERLGKKGSRSYQMEACNITTLMHL